MKFLIAFLFSLALLTLFGTAGSTTLENGSGKLKLSMDIEKNFIRLGEPVHITFVLANEQKEAMAILLDDFGVSTGNLHVQISSDGKHFTGFNNPKWGRIDSSRKTFIEPRKIVRASGSVLWSWLNQGGLQFRLKEPGDYYVKATYLARVAGENVPLELESEPVKITVAEPIGEDLEVWDKIKANGDFAFFILEGDFYIPSYKTQERTNLQREVEEIVARYPNSFYAESLSQSLAKFKAAEAKRKEVLENLKKQKSP